MMNAWLALDFLRAQNVLTNHEPAAFNRVSEFIKEYQYMVRDELKKQE